ncbi:LamG domain-containing protein [Paenibacillus sp. 2RAB27]|uniref:LamG domain-containing protein n=1 Tax=Paenibacillus sp. 2RAB27 TaxID=3232991 RepID=UPI003F95B271
MKQTWTKFARFILGAVLLVSSGYALLGYEDQATASTPVVVISPQQTVITNTTTEVVMQAPIGAKIEIFEGEEKLIAKDVEGYSVVKMDLPALSNGVHMLTAQVLVGMDRHHFTLPPFVVHQSGAFTIEDISTIALELPDHQEWDMNGDNEFVPQDEIAYLLSRMDPIANVNPIDDLSVVQSATTATYTTFTYSKPVGATSVSLLRKRASDEDFITVASLNVNEATYIVNGLMPDTTYQFKLDVIGGIHAGESNVVSVVTVTEIPPVQPEARPYQALDFDGVDDYVQITHDEIYNSSSFTIEAWVKPKAFVWKTGIVSKYQEHNQASFTLRLSDGPPIHADYNKINFSDGGDLDSVVNLELNRWYHLAALYDGTSRTMKLYINGVLDSQIGNVGYSTNSSPMTIGVDFLDKLNSNQAARYFNGQIGEVRFWTVARSEAQIRADMNNHAETQNDPNLAGYWTFKDGANDESGNGRHGSIHGNPATN